MLVVMEGAARTLSAICTEATIALLSGTSWCREPSVWAASTALRGATCLALLA